jgi:hypothetical protein
MQRTPEAPLPSALLAPEPSQPLVQRESMGEAFRPLTRLRDPRLSTRLSESVVPPRVKELPLNLLESTAVLPQARTPAAMPLASERVQRRAVAQTALTERTGPELVPQVGNAAFAASPIASSVVPHIQRMPDIQRDSTRNASRQAANRERTRAVSVRPKEKVRRSPMPLAKVTRATRTESVQREPEEIRETFVGSTAGNSARASTQTENLGVSGENHSMNSLPNSQSDSHQNNHQNEQRADNAAAPDLDRLARAILPVVKRMLAIERDRRNPSAVR